MGLTYLKGKNWIDISREERLFCSHLYHKIKSHQDIKEFIKWLNETISPVKDFKNEIKLNPDQHWEVAYESCFYRDLLKLHGYGVKEKLEDFKKIEAVGDYAINLIKRTFDLALFSDDTIVIIEAKSAGKLELKQFKDFEIDELLIKEVFKYLNLNSPKIVFIVLATDKYFNSKAFSSKKGIGKINIVDKQKMKENKIHGLISWKQLIDSNSFTDNVFLRAEESYKNK